MKFSLQVGMCEPSHYLPMVKAAEDAGYNSIALPDSICYPKEATSIYPYNDDGSRDFIEDIPFIESLIAVTHMAAVTSKIRFATFVYKLAIRQVACVAKQVQSINILSNNRFDFGIGISPWKEDFAVAQTPFAKRGERLDEQIEIFRGLETGDYFGFKGNHHDMPANKMQPVPTQATPLLIGGHSEPALKRAARVGDGWMCAGADMTELKKYIARIDQLRNEYGTTEKPFAIWTTGANATSQEGIAELEDAGVTEVVIGFRNIYEKEPDRSLEQKLDMLRGYASTFIK